MKQSYKNSLSIILIVVVSFLTVNNVLYTHLHKMSDGSVVVHAHPFKNDNPDSPGKQSHDHTQKEILLISSLNTLLFTGLIAQISIILNNTLVNFIQPVKRKESTFYNKISGRAPPFYNLS